MSGKETVEFAREAMLVQLQLQLESLMSIAKNCRDTVHRLRGMMPPATRPGVASPPSRGRLITDRVLAAMPEDVRPQLSAVMTNHGSVAITAPWLGRGAWNVVNGVVEGFGGVWRAEGKMSRWEVPVPAGEEAGG